MNTVRKYSRDAVCYCGESMKGHSPSPPGNHMPKEQPMTKDPAAVKLGCNHTARTKLLMKFWSAMHLAGFAKGQEWEAQEKIHIKDLVKLLKHSAKDKANA